jgi:transmembrane sensor
MQNEREYLAALIQKYQEGTVTEKEKEILTRWLIQLDADDFDLTENELQIKQQLSLAALRDKLQPSVQAPKVLRLSLWIKAVAAMLVIAGGLYLYTKPQHKPAKTNTLVKNDLPPGTNKAVLTLSNGSKINLNAAGNGVLAKQGNISVEKYDKGKVTYTANNNNAVVKPVFNTITTPKGGQYQVVLPDGTKAWLNAASYITFPTVFEAGKRDVEIGGEVYFEVAKNKEKPFSVTCAGQKLTVLGTHFNVNAYTEEAVIKTTLLEGSVKISNGADNVVLKPGQQSLITAGSENKIQVSSSVDLDEVVAWKNGFFQFNRADIRTIMNQISRWYNVDIEVSGKLPDGHYRGNISRNVNLSKVLKVMELSGIHFTIEGRKIIVKQ